jgi:four helix bundle protein
MTSFTSFEEIKVWQKSRILTKKIRVVCRRENVKRDFAFVDQISRSSRSIMDNIAEGFESQTNRQFVTFLGYAKRSCAEVRSQLYGALDDGYITTAECKDLMLQAHEIGKMLYKLIQHLQSQPNRSTWR